MNCILPFVVKHGYAALLSALFAHPMGLPVPALLFLLALGLLAAVGKLGSLHSLRQLFDETRRS